MVHSPHCLPFVLTQRRRGPGAPPPIESGEPSPASVSRTWIDSEVEGYASVSTHRSRSPDIAGLHRRTKRKYRETQCPRGIKCAHAAQTLNVCSTEVRKAGIPAECWNFLSTSHFGSADWNEIQLEVTAEDCGKRKPIRAGNRFDATTRVRPASRKERKPHFPTTNAEFISHPLFFLCVSPRSFAPLR